MSVVAYLRLKYSNMQYEFQKMTKQSECFDVITYDIILMLFFTTSCIGRSKDNLMIHMGIPSTPFSPLPSIPLLSHSLNSLSLFPFPSLNSFLFLRSRSPYSSQWASGSAVRSPSEICGGAPAEIDFRTF